MLKQGYEDYMRHKADRVINHKLVTRVETNGINQIKSQDIQVGDILCVEDGEEFPCDLLILASSNANGKATVMTANLDGETNLKTISASALTRDMNQPHLLNNLRAQVSLVTDGMISLKVLFNGSSTQLGSGSRQTKF
jgi:phospholipid-translocating ATPase